MFRFAKEPFVCQVVVSWNHLRDARLFSSSVETRRKSLASPLADRLSIPFICGLFLSPMITPRKRSLSLAQRLSSARSMPLWLLLHLATILIKITHPSYYFKHRVKVNLVSLDAVIHFVTHCLLCTDRHFYFPI